MVSELSTQTFVAIVAAIAAISSAVFACKSSSTARKMFEIAEAEHKKKALSITPYLIDSAMWHNENNECIVGFHLKLSNASSAPNAITTSQLIFKNGLSQIVLNPKENVFNNPWNADIFSSSFKLDPAECKIGVIAFNIPSAITNKKDIKKYSLTCTTLNGDNITLDSYILKDVTNEIRKA